jgi:hypothetical protein
MINAGVDDDVDNEDDGCSGFVSYNMLSTLMVEL